MKTAPRGIRTLRAALLFWALGLAQPCLAQDAPPATSFIVPKSDKECDAFNRSWRVTNQHTYLSIKVTVRWQAVGGREVQEEFILPPGANRGIGCAPNVEIVSAELLQF